ncbi:MAG: hypothetical protein ACI4L9_07145 [Candidatus Coproplasma sp.]
MDSIKQAVSDAVKMEYKNGALTLTVNVEGTTVTVYLKDFGIKFSVDSNERITSVLLECADLSVNVKTVSYGNVDDVDCYVCSETKVTCSLEISLNLNSGKSIKDITGAATTGGATVGEIISATE